MYVFWSNLYSIFRNEQELHSYTKWLVVFGFMLGSLLTFLGWKYQSPDVSLFDIHGAIMLLLIIDVCIFTISMAVTILPSFNRIHLPFFKGVFLISGVVASDLILLMLAPPFGWFIFTICASVMILLLYRSRREILQHCQEILKPMWHSTFEAFHGLCDWFQQNPSSLLQGRVSHFWSSCLWLNFVDVCSSFWVVHLHYMCICYGIITLSITQRDSPMLSRNSWTNVALHFWGIPQFMWLVSTEFPINLDSTFPSIQWILNASTPNMKEKHVLGSVNNV